MVSVKLEKLPMLCEGKVLYILVVSWDRQFVATKASMCLVRSSVSAVIYVSNANKSAIKACECQPAVQRAMLALAIVAEFLKQFQNK